MSVALLDIESWRIKEEEYEEEEEEEEEEEDYMRFGVVCHAMVECMIELDGDVLG